MHAYLLRRLLRSILLVAAICVALALAGSSVRLLPWLASDVVPLRVSLVFAQALVLAALEVALVVAPALGVALELSRCSSEGTTTALFCAGAGPGRQLKSVATAAGLAALLCLLISATWGSRSSHPGVLTNQMIDAGRPDCPHDRLSQSPLLGVSWLCVGPTPLLVGSLGAGQGGWTAKQVHLSDDLRSITAQEVEAMSHRPAVRARFGHVTVHGLVPWTAASSLPGLARGSAFALAAMASTLATAWFLLRRPTPSVAVAMLTGASGPVAFLSAAPMLLEHGAWAAALGAALVAGAAPWLAFAARRWLRLPVQLRGGTNC